MLHDELYADDISLGSHATQGFVLEADSLI